MATLDPDDSRPPFRQVADALRQRIRGGEWGAAERLPSYRALAAAYGVAEGTVKRALALLRAEGLLVTRQGAGSYIRAAGARPTTAGGEEDLAGKVRALADRVSLIEAQLDHR